MTVWRNDFVQKNQYTRPGTPLTSVKKLVLHWTADPGATAKNEHDYFNGTCIKEQRAASAHIFVDENEAVCIVPLNEVAYHANGNNEMVNGVPYRGVPEIAPNANLKSIGVEMCVQKDGTISQATINRTVDVFVELCKTYKLTENDIVRHYDVTHKDCPSPFVSNIKQFNDFKALVKSKLNLVAANPVQPTTSPTKPVPLPVPNPTIKLNDQGNQVKQLQTLLNSFGYKCGNADGIFGSNTKAALVLFQIANKLVGDGIYGKLSQAKFIELINK